MVKTLFTAFIYVKISISVTPYHKPSGNKTGHTAGSSPQPAFSYLSVTNQNIMRTAFFFLAVAFWLAACNHQTKEASPVVKGKTFVSLPVKPAKVEGTYIGDFKGSPIAITLNYVTDRHVTGYNVHKGLTRNISGTIEAKEDGLHLQLSEPGNNQYDGVFNLVINTKNWTGTGTWKPLKKGEYAAFSFKKQAATTEEEQWGITFTDSLQNAFTLKPDGSCTYTYLADTTHTGQEITIRGNYTRDKKTVTVYWQKNEVFPQKSVFKLVERRPYPDEEYVEKSLKGEGKEFTQLWD